MAGIFEKEKCQKCIKKDAEIKKLNETIKKFANDVEEKPVTENKLDFVNSETGEKIHLQKTNLLCWYDCHKFDTIPLILPETYVDGTYYGKGCFCSTNCQIAYNVYVLRDSKVHERIALCYQMYRDLYGLSPDQEINLEMAGPRELLEAFGGELTIDQYRSNFLRNDKKYIVGYPPIKCKTVHIESRDNKHSIDTMRQYKRRN